MTSKVWSYELLLQAATLLHQIVQQKTLKHEI